MANPLQLENVWLHQQKFEDAHTLYMCLQAGTVKPGAAASGSGGDAAVYKGLEALEKENKELRKITDELRALILTVQSSVGSGDSKPAAAPAAAAAKPAADDDDDDDDDFDMFGSDDDDEEAAALKEKRLKEYAEKKAKKPGPIAKSNVILDVKPWDDETD